MPGQHLTPGTYKIMSTAQTNLFNTTKEENRKISAILDRLTSELSEVNFDNLSARMDLSACHCNGCPLDFDRMLEAEIHVVAHDVFGIARFIDRDNGKLSASFLPALRKREEPKQPQPSKGEQRYADSLEAAPNYADGTPRKAWDDLPDYSKAGWETNHNA